jgi:hypothetical protein
MRKINKNLALATAYKSWLEKLAKDGSDHPAYNSANHKFYYDIVANLLWVQQGLCAYTEMYLINPADIEPKKWEKGKFSKFEFLGQLDHYNPSLKDKLGWDWDNFFMVHSDVNVKRKGQKKGNNILKPDEAHYDPLYYLEYDFKTHNFLPNRSRDFDEQQKILEDIHILGLNFKPIIDYRKDYLKPLMDDVLLGKVTIVEARKSLQKFYTAFDMSINNLGILPNS